MSNAVALVYDQVINDVIDNVKKDFEDMGVENEVLEELRRSWTHKVRSSRVASWGDGYYGESDTVKYKEEDRVRYEAAANLTMLATPANMEAARQHLYMPTKNGSVPTPASSVPASGIATVILPAQNQSLVDQQNLDQKIYPAAPSQAQELETFVEPKIPESSRLVTHSIGDYNAPPQVPAAQQPTDDGRRNTAHNGSSYADDDEINSDLDDPDEEENAENEESQNIILCLYDKVTRTKNKWKCQLKDGVMSVNGKDYLFHKGTGDFEF